MTARRRALPCVAAAALAALAAPAGAQSVVGIEIGNAPATDDAGNDLSGSADDLPPEASPKVVDLRGITACGGTSIDPRRTFQETTGSDIYTPIGTEIYTPIGTDLSVPASGPRG